MNLDIIVIILILVSLFSIFCFFIWLIVFFASNNNTKIALNVDYYMCLTCFVLIAYSFLKLLFNPYSHTYEKHGLPGDGGDEILVLSPWIYLTIIIAVIIFAYCFFINNSILNIKKRLRAQFKLFLLVFLIIQIMLIQRQRNIIDKMDYSEFEQHFKEMGYSEP
jgi:hypothetical protein